ncbi:dTMP kinase [Limnochorda pilosa]|uniref:Thymidylate kinase n=1 Tax=Limnochorda pilosa TaxID=1555112 RepID=A0A0K2SPH4_LIMPI|nr:dTMP kinase [Limnochorda pilosa]BAS29006.1 thymidylate kinase [Limnochorda pilosa]
MGSGRRGTFITFEGPDGSGKTTHAHALARTLRGRGLQVVETYEPGGTPLGAHLREILLGRGQAGAGDLAPVPMAEMLLLAADRAQHVERVIRPALEEGAWVICDRYVDSSLVYQGYAADLDLEHVRWVNRWATRGLVPDLTFLLDPGPSGALAGRAPRHGAGPQHTRPGTPPPDRFEDRGDAFWQRVREGYLAVWRDEPDRVHRIETAGRDPQAVAREILDLIVSRGLLPGEGRA